MKDFKLVAESLEIASASGNVEMAELISRLIVQEVVKVLELNGALEDLQRALEVKFEDIVSSGPKGADRNWGGESVDYYKGYIKALADICGGKK